MACKEEVVEKMRHPIETRLEALGVDDKAMKGMILLVFNDLFDVKLWPELSLVFHPDESQPPLLAGRPRENGPMTLIQTRSGDSPICLKSIHSELTLIQEKFSAKLLMVAFVYSDSTIVYNNLSASTIPPRLKACPKQGTAPSVKK